MLKAVNHRQWTTFSGKLSISIFLMLSLYAVVQMMKVTGSNTKELTAGIQTRAVSEKRTTKAPLPLLKEIEGKAFDDPQLVEYVKNKKLILPSTEPLQLANPKLNDSSQFRQSPELDAILHKMKNGFFVEVGAHDGEYLSNTLFFERFRNWTGLLIEANPASFKGLLSKKRNAYAINGGLSLHRVAEKVTFNDAGVMGRINENKANKGVTIECFPLYTLLLAIGRSQIDLFSLDIEGDELKVLKTIPWDKMQIRLLMVEVNHIKEGPEEVKKYMKSVGYTFIKALLIDLIFAKQELLDETKQ